jgi:hypothetical protein
VRLPGAALYERVLPMSHTRPSGTGWVSGQQGEPVEVQADPPGDGIGPDLTPPDAVPGLDAKEVRRLQRDHRELLKASESDRPDVAAPEPNDTEHDPAQRAAFPTPFDPREGRADS